MKQNSLIVPILICAQLVLCGCTSGAEDRAGGLDENRPEVQWQKKVDPRMLDEKQRQEIREILETFYDEDRRGWEKGRLRVLAMGPPGEEALCLFLIKFFAGGKEIVPPTWGEKELGSLWQEARNELVRLGTIAVPYLIYAMGHPKMGTTGALNCSQTLVAMGTVAVSGLITNIQQGSPKFRRTVLFTLGKIGDRRATAPIVSFYQSLPKEASADEDQVNTPAALRHACLKALGELGDEIALPMLREALKDPDSFVRQGAVESLLHFSSPAAIPALQEALMVCEKEFPKLQIAVLRCLQLVREGS